MALKTLDDYEKMFLEKADELWRNLSIEERLGYFSDEELLQILENRKRKQSRS